MEKEWAKLTPDEKREERFKRWLSPPDVEFSSPEAEKAYKERVTRFIKTIKLEEPDRVPVMLPAGFLPAYYGGGTLKTAMYDYDELKRAWLKFLNDFEMDTFAGPGFVLPGKMLDRIDYKFHLWPGHGLADHLSSYQFIEGEYMKPEEYDAFIRDPADFLLRVYLPRSAGAFAGLRKLGPLTPFIGIPVFYITQFGDPEIRAAVQALLDAGQEGAKWQAALAEVGQAAREAGVPSLSGGLCGAPFDLMGDMMRGTKEIMLDMYRRPDKLLEAMERMTPILIDEAIGMANASGGPVIFMPLHKGTGGLCPTSSSRPFTGPPLKR